MPITLALADVKDLPALEEIERECDSYFLFDPPCASEHNRSIKECLAIGDIIPGVAEENFIKEKYFFYCVWQENTIIGFLSYYLGYQREDTVYLSVLYVKEAYRRKNIGTEILETLISKLKTAKCKTIRTHCSLRNATALRFWVKSGFNHIIDIECDGNLFAENFGGMELMKVIAEKKE